MLARMEKFDYIIVGAGTAGCVLANRLSANPAHRVLLIESGGKDNYFWIDIPVGYLYTINNPRCDWCFKTDAEPGLNNRQIGYARGKGLGGSPILVTVRIGVNLFFPFLFADDLRHSISSKHTAMFVFCNHNH